MQFRRRLAGIAGALCLTLPAAAATLLVTGDTGDCQLPGSRLVATALRAQPDWRTALLVEVGDLAYPTATRERLEACHEPHFRDFRRVAVPGNHDWDDAAGRGFFALFPQALPRAIAVAPRWQLLLLNSNLSGAAMAEQAAWLAGQLANAGDACLIAAWHHPRWSSGAHGDDDRTAALWSLLAPRASFTLHGHDHHFEALPPLDAAGKAAADGLPSFVVGIGGARLYQPGRRLRSGRASFGRWGFLRIDLAGEHYRWQAIDTAGEVFDRGDGACRSVVR